MAKDEGIEDLHATTLRVGKKELEAMAALHGAGKLNKVLFVVGGIMANDKGHQYDYFSVLLKTCERIGWRFAVVRNHSKIILMHTRVGNHYVLETSSNLNENPSIEQFGFCNDQGLYCFYRKFIDDLAV